jgi:hypothetical protein
MSETNDPSAVDPQSREPIVEHVNWSPEMASHNDYAPAPVSEPSRGVLTCDACGRQVISTDGTMPRHARQFADPPQWCLNGLYRAPVSDPKGEGLAALMVPETIHSIVESTKHISIGVPRVVQLERAIDRIAALSRRSTVTPAEERRCLVTGNMCGTDTMQKGTVCLCAPCRAESQTSPAPISKWLARERAHRALDEYITAPNCAGWCGSDSNRTAEEAFYSALSVALAAEPRCDGCLAEDRLRESITGEETKP